MELEEYIKSKVSGYYWNDDVNCATTMLKTLAELYEIELDRQVIDSAIGLHGAGGFGAQCGLVEGSLMLLGIFGKENKLSTEIIIALCYCFAQEFEEEFGSLLCKQLRPQGFKPDNPPHLCEGLTNRAVKFTAEYLERKIG
ncbi:C_GCAxxG_C_C family protein|uniref:C_GCAxxG_C_C family probable redox protein n=1 Tax=Dendrosporobacter quercicolus TaxID=146817 RepID=A0A1G9YEM3_9FIRM|nr:C-GCAxxG-C-C family protein [Dendrosporobacter quercicolus]NSL47614.1 C_GCAxxG_C_C family protein [Dendrosporobacter quercicolus DSM 1736]SDN06945.1 C_GCAxxG_C_C family probable redox protein [Dendrosporobacter quercicolus]